MFYGYIRVSTEEQNLENQKKAISEKYKIRKWIEEKRSGTVDFHKIKFNYLLCKKKESQRKSNFDDFLNNSKIYGVF